METFSFIESEELEESWKVNNLLTWDPVLIKAGSGNYVKPY